MFVFLRQLWGTREFQQNARCLNPHFSIASNNKTSRTAI
jgi:hypothetical protein